MDDVVNLELRRLSQRLRGALAEPRPAWVAASLRGCLRELEQLDLAQANELQIAGLLARGESLLAIGGPREQSS